MNWLHHLPIPWMALLIFGGVYLVAAVIHLIVIRLAAGERARAFTAISSGMLPPLGVVFALFVAFLAAQVWGDFDRAQAAVNREASALRDVVILSARFPGEPQARLSALVRRHIEEAVSREWPAMGAQRASLTELPDSLVEAIHLTLALTPRGASEELAQRELLTRLETALDARRQRIITSRSTISWLKWTGLAVQMVCFMVAIAMVHCDNPRGSALAMALFASAAVACILLIAAYNRPFTGHISAGPEVLLQVLPPK